MIIQYCQDPVGLLRRAGSLYLVASLFASAWAMGPALRVSMPCPDEIYSAVLNRDRYQQECYRLAVPASGTFAPDAPPAVYPPNPMEEGGMFEIRVTNLFWPDKLSVCPMLTVRMPWSDPHEQQSAIAGKRDFRDVLDSFAAGRSAAALEVFPIDVMVTRDSLLHSDRDAAAAEVYPSDCLIFFQTDGQTGRYLPSGERKPIEIRGQGME